MVFKKIKGYLMKKYFHQIREPTQIFVFLCKSLAP